MTNQELIAKSMSERELQDAVIKLAHTLGWLVMHSRPAKLANGEYRTAISGDKGFFDLVLAKKGMVIFAELKSEKGRMSYEQHEWQQAVKTSHIWRPSDWLSSEIERILKGV
jgi:hypothetical protein